MRVLVAFDKFKDALTATEACEIAARVLREKHPDWQLDLCPLSDGGDGFEHILGSAVGGHRIARQATGPRGGMVEAGLTFVPKDRIPAAALARLEFSPGSDGESTLAIVEMATVSGLALLLPGQRTPWETTSRGTGQLIKAAVELGAKSIVLGVGGSATHDLGTGALTALGFEFRDATGNPLRPPTPSHWEQIVHIDGSVPASLPPIAIACDVTNSLLGPKGAATVFAPQKGLHADELSALETASERMAHLLCAHCHQPPTLPNTPGSGAAGGIAFGLVCAAGAKLLPGFAFVSDWLGLDHRIAQADLIITGEGRFDSSSLGGKGPGALLTKALAARKRVQLFAGLIASSTTHDLLTLHEITPTDVPLDRALREVKAHLSRSIEHAL